MVEAINGVAPGSAQALDGRQIQVRAPEDPNQRVAFLGRLENLDVTPPSGRQGHHQLRTGSVVMNQKVPCRTAPSPTAASPSPSPTSSRSASPAPSPAGQTAVTNKGGVDIKQEGGNIFNVKGGTNLADVVKALNAVGANPSN